MLVFFCIECGIELDKHDVDANIATWGDFKSVCTDCVADVDNRINPPKRTAAIWNGKVIY